MMCRTHQMMCRTVGLGSPGSCEEDGRGDPARLAGPLRFQAGNPYGTSHASNNGARPPGEVDHAAMVLQTRPAVEFAGALTRGLGA